MSNLINANVYIYRSRMQSPSQNDIEVMAARVQQSAHQLNMMGLTTGVTNGSKEPSQTILNRSDADSGVLKES